MISHFNELDNVVKRRHLFSFESTHRLQFIRVTIYYENNVSFFSSYIEITNVQSIPSIASNSIVVNST